MSHYLSFLMGGENIQDSDLENVSVKIKEKDSDGDRKIIIPSDKISDYIELIKSKLTAGFWNEMIGEDEIVFLFKLKDGTIKEYRLSPENEHEIDKLCAELNNESPDKTANVYKYISENSFYHDFMVKYWSNMINR